MPDQENQKNYELAYRYHQSLVACERITQQDLLDHQRSVAATFLEHVERHAPFHRKRLAPIKDADGTYCFDRWHEVRIMTKQDLICHHDSIRCPVVPADHGHITFAQSSATTGSPVRIAKTQLTDLATACAAYRHAENHGVDWSRDLAYIRALATQPPTFEPPDPDGRLRGPPWLAADDRGKKHWLQIHHHPQYQLDWLTRREPIYLNTLPSNALRLAQEVDKQGSTPPKIEAIYSVGETVDSDIRVQCREHLGCEIIDVFATSECGSIATQCPVSGGYHILSELAIVEVIGDDGTACDYGQPGRLVVTPLFNLAMPLIRYRLDDYVSLSPPCPCGRPSPLIGTIHGRRDGLFAFSNGTTGRLNISTTEMSRYLGGCRWQLVQTGENTAELRYMQTPRQDTVDTAGAIDFVRLHTGKDIHVTCCEVAALGPSSAGKYSFVYRELEHSIT